MSERIMIFIPAYRCEKQIPRVLAQFTPDIQKLFEEIVVVDNRSPDNTREAAAAALQNIAGCKVTLLQNNQNYGLGGSHKVALRYAFDHGYDYGIVLHGDDQGDIHDIVPLLHAGEHRRYDCLLSARFMPGSTLGGYSLFRTFGNIVFNILFSLATMRLQWDLGSGLCCYSKAFMQSKLYEKCSDDLTFNYTLQLYAAPNHVSQKFFPVSWREDDQISNVKLVRQTWQMVKLLAHFVFQRRAFLATNRSQPGSDYTATIVMQRGGNRLDSAPDSSNNRARVGTAG
jgi:glycosyltransferase involved in cell wall biosynthesis